MANRKLDILVPQYKETDEIIKPLLDSIAIQQSVDLEHDVGVIIANDGTRTKLTKEFLDSYPFTIEYHSHRHGGVSSTRNACLDHSKADYVIFCDADDMLFHACGLWMIFREMEKGFDTMVSTFIEENKDPKTGNPVYISHEKDATFVHGKVHKREYLLENDIRWNDSLTVHEDSYFNILCQSLTKNILYMSTPWYLWKWRDASICRHDKKYILKTYNNLLDSNDALVQQFLDRDMKDKAEYYATMMIFDAYYTMAKPKWINQENKEYRYNVEKRFTVYYEKYKYLWDDINPKMKMFISNGVRTRSVGEGMQMESVTIDEWLRRR